MAPPGKLKIPCKGGKPSERVVGEVLVPQSGGARDGGGDGVLGLHAVVRSRGDAAGGMGRGATGGLGSGAATLYGRA